MGADDCRSTQRRLGTSHCGLAIRCYNELPRMRIGPRAVRTADEPQTIDLSSKSLIRNSAAPDWLGRRGVSVHGYRAMYNHCRTDQRHAIHPRFPPIAP